MERFWEKVEKTETCWNWTAAKSSFGYGRFKLNGKLVSPHRLVYEWEYGEIPDELDVCHHCDNPACVNPKHLFLGNRSDNMLDASKKGRINIVSSKDVARGENAGASKLSEEDIKNIRSMSEILSRKELSKQYGVNQRTIQRIISRETWTHI